MEKTENIYAESLRNGNREAYTQLFTQWYEPLCNYACSILRNMDEAEDAVQKMFYKLWDKREELLINTSVKSYLYRAVHNDCLNRVKQRKVQTEHNVHYNYGTNKTSDNVEQNVLHNELEREITRAIDLLPPQCKKVFEMSRMQQLSYAEIAETLQISSNTVENHIAKALRLLRTQLKDYLPLALLLTLLSK